MLIESTFACEPELLLELQALPECELGSDFNALQPELAPLELTCVEGTAQLTNRLTGSRIQISFVQNDLMRRLRPANLNGELVVRAVVGRSKKRGLRVLDATAGLGRDGLLLAGAGCEITLAERMPVLGILLRRAVQQALNSDNAELANAVAHMRGVLANSIEVLNASPEIAQLAPEVVYLDPMYQPPGNKAVAGLKPSAAVNKRMATLHVLDRITAAHYPQMQVPDEADTLFEAAIAHATSKVVVKRAPKAPWLAGHKPSSVLGGKTSRFDIYACSA